MNLFQRAAKNLNLSPFERGIYHFVQLVTKSLGPIGALPFVSDLMKSVNTWLATGHWTSFDYLSDLHLLVVMLLTALVAAVQHVLSSQNDPPLGAVLPTVLTITGTDLNDQPVSENVTWNGNPSYFRSGATDTPDTAPLTPPAPVTPVATPTALPTDLTPVAVPPAQDTPTPTPAS